MEHIMKQAASGKMHLINIITHNQVDKNIIPTVLVEIYHFHQYSLSQPNTNIHNRELVTSPQFYQVMESLALMYTGGDQKKAVQVLDLCKRTMGKEWMALGLCSNDTCSI